ncbi:hypothetical protein [Frondihabitans cladoniiphilus]|uniref:Transcriptional regulator, AbiEi antitoxin, Type IV TA system n=1 Tax=Frondihabitans cladoniiphilus TaxID=715785 RepID=A0ABP8W219_9MICO
MDPFAPGSDGLLRRTDFVRAGRNDRALRRAADRGALVGLVPGVFIAADTWHAAGAGERHLLRAAAVADRLGPLAVFSHATASAAHGWSHLSPWPEVPDVTDPTVRRSRTGSTMRTHAFPLAGTDVDALDGLPVTAAGRTAVDLAASLPFRDAVVSLDSALAPAGPAVAGRQRARKTVLTLEAFDLALERRLPVRGHNHVARVRAFADGCSGSVGESLSRVVMQERGWPPPILQEPFVDASGTIGRVDFWWPEFGVIGEFDGAVKYSRAEYLGGMTPAQAAVREKRREDRLRAHPRVRGFARWMWDDIHNTERFARVLAAAGLPVR